MKKKRVVYIGGGLFLFGLAALLMNFIGVLSPLVAWCMHQPAALGVLAGLGMLGFTAEDKTELEKMLEKVGDKHKDAIKTEVQAAIAAQSLGKDFADTFRKEFSDKLETLGVKADAIKNLIEAVDKQGERMRKYEAAENTKDETIESIVETKVEEIKKLSKLTQGQPNLTITIPRKAILKTQITRASVSGTTMAMRLPGLGELPYLGLKLSQLFKHAQVAPSSNGVIRFYDQLAITRGAAPVAEGATKPESAITWIERMLKVEKIADSIPVTKEAWTDVYFIQSEIDRLLNLNLAIKEDQQLWSGTGVTPEITGVYTNSTDFDPAPYAGSVVDPNIYDLVATMRVAIMNSKQSKYDPNIVVMNPVDLLKLRLTKDEFGRYLFPTDSVPAINGMTAIESSQVTANTLLVGDSRYATIYDLEDVNLEMGYINDQFIKNAMTLLAEKRETLLIRNVDADAFLKSTDIAADAASLA